MKRILSELRLYFANHVINKIPSHFVRKFYYKKIMGFKIGRGSAINLGCTFDAARNLTIGENSIINENCRIDTRGKVTIGNNVSISSNVTILTADHDMDDDMKGRCFPVNIDDYVWIGTSVIILPKVSLSKGVVAAAGCLVSKSVPELKVVAGIPAKIIKQRLPSYNYDASYIRLFK
ncbi:acyltransferase [Leeuwenhoekiella nanhaiensis]|uniref:Acetyltransferase n=1 Tax=Leeuwenhoekiella nanhaiensis TaxID=1655491 RepID=A0A2G1VNG8_9FLAO|nr:acyltransferase [Leeuwenhoekiella nanhaiensis]PHQ28284.1 hypothetical protein CJ305_15725 [Leeuwenhoekiella nanhaiensis]